MTKTRFIGFTLVALLLQAVAPSAQTPAATPPPATPPTARPTPPPADNYTYQPESRRDPFVSLLKSGVDTRVAAKRGEGPAAIGVNELSVRGVLQSRTGMMAMIQGPDNKTYIVRPGDKLLDGTIKSITSQGLVVDQEVSDPLSIAKHRDVTRLLRSLEAAKEQ